MGANRSGSPDTTVDVAVGLADPECEFVSRLSSIEGSTYRGHRGLRRYFEDMADAWQEWDNDVIEMTAVGPDAVLVDATFRAPERVASRSSFGALLLGFSRAEG